MHNCMDKLTLTRIISSGSQIGKKVISKQTINYIFVYFQKRIIMSTIFRKSNTNFSFMAALAAQPL